MKVNKNPAIYLNCWVNVYVVVIIDSGCKLIDFNVNASNFMEYCVCVCMLWIERRALPRLSFHVNWFFACQPNTFCRWLWSNRLSSPSWIHDVNNFFHSFYFVGDKFKKKNQYRVWMRLDAVAVSSWPIRCHLENGEIWTRDAITCYRSNYENNRIRWHTALRMHFISLAHWMMSERMDGMCHGIQLLQ